MIQHGSQNRSAVPSVGVHVNLQKLEAIRFMLFCTSKFLVPSAVIAG